LCNLKKLESALYYPSMIKKYYAFFVLLLIVSPIISLSSPAQSVVTANSAVNIWWPTDQKVVTGITPFKADLPGYDISQYTMYWQVDNGDATVMNNSYTDYPHKEAMVDLSNWNWKGTGPYVLSFTAKDNNGNLIGQQTSTIYTGTPVTAPANSSGQVTSPVVTTVAPTSAPVPVPAPAVIQPAPTVPTGTISVWWPSDNAHIKGAQPFKAVVDGKDITAYKMYWQVDGNAKNEMPNNYADAPHKESIVDVSAWNWNSNTIYAVTFSAIDTQGNTIAQKKVSVYNDSAPAPVTHANNGNPLANQALYVNKNSAVAVATQQPTAAWFGNWNSAIETDVSTYVSAAAAQAQMPVLVAYNIPGRDCGSYSAGGANGGDAYKQWIQSFAQGIGNKKAVVILEPDALAGMDCLQSSGQADRVALIKNAVTALKANANTIVYIDAGNSNWQSTDTMATRLTAAGISNADGFSLNVSNFYTNDQIIPFGTALSQKLNGKHFVMDTSRNGNGDNGQWCNPSGRALGLNPTTNTGNPIIDAFLWIKTPGESDGNCNGGPAAGVWWPQYLADLIKNKK
jgi:endoglucanase